MREGLSWGGEDGSLQKAATKSNSQGLMLLNLLLLVFGQEQGKLGVGGGAGGRGVCGEGKMED